MTTYAVSPHPSGGLLFAGTDLNGRPFSLRLDGQAAHDAGARFQTVLFAHMAHTAVRDEREPFETVSEGVEKS